MRRQVLAAALYRVSDDLQASGIIKSIRDAIESSRLSKSEVKKNYLAPFQKYSILTANYSDAEKEVLDIFEIDVLLDPDFWESITSSGTDNPSQIYLILHRIDTINDTVPKLLELLKQDDVLAFRDVPEKLPEHLRGRELLTLIIPEEDRKRSNPLRFSYGIEAINTLYIVHASLRGLNTEELAMIACDSGSDKSFDFTGASRIVQEVKGTILAIWDRVVFHRHGQAKADIENIAKSLPVFAEIATLEASASISPETAELLRRKIVSGCTKFIEVGGIIPEMDIESRQSPRALMKPEQKLLAAPSAGEAQHPQSASPVRPAGNEKSLHEEIDELKKTISELSRPKRTRRKGVS